MSMIQILKDLGYNYEEQTFDGFYKLSGKERLALQSAKHEEFANNPKIGLCEFVQFVRSTLDKYFDNIYIGRVLNMSINEDSIVEVQVSALLHSKFTDKNKLEAQIEFEEQLDVLASHGIEFEKVKKALHYQMKDHDENRRIITELLSLCGAYGMSFVLRNGYIREFSFRFHAKDISKWFVYTPPKPNITSDRPELNDDEFNNVRSCLFHIPHALDYANKDPHMRKTCCYVAEGQFSELCRLVGFNGSILKNIDERYREERESNAQIRDLSNIIGSEFPADLCEDVVTETKSSLMRFCISKLHSVVQEYKLNPFGDIEAKIKWISDPDDMVFYIEEEALIGKTVNTLEDVDNEFDIVRNDYFVHALNNPGNMEKFVKILSEIVGLRIKNMKSEFRDDLGNIFVISEIDIVIESVKSLIE